MGIISKILFKIWLQKRWKDSMIAYSVYQLIIVVVWL